MALVLIRSLIRYLAVRLSMMVVLSTQDIVMGRGGAHHEAVAPVDHHVTITVANTVVLIRGRGGDNEGEGRGTEFWGGGTACGGSRGIDLAIPLSLEPLRMLLLVLLGR